MEFIRVPSLVKINFSKTEKRINPPFCLALIVVIIIIGKILEIMIRTVISKHVFMELIRAPSLVNINSVLKFLTQLEFRRYNFSKST